MAPEPRDAGLPPLRWTVRWRLVHLGIVVLLATEFLYATYMVFVVYAPPSGGLILGSAAPSLPFDWLQVRRLYALEAWVAFGALAVYLGVTEIAPRRRAPP